MAAVAAASASASASVSASASASFSSAYGRRSPLPPASSHHLKDPSHLSLHTLLSLHYTSRLPVAPSRRPSSHSLPRLPSRSLPIHASQGSTERSYVMVKPDGVQRGLIGEIISRFEKKGFLIKGLKLFSCPKELAEEHYKELSSKPFFPKLVKYITSGPVVCLALEGPGVVASARKLIGVTNPLLAEPGTIRGDLGIEVGRNVVHGSDSTENGEREIGLWFKEGELCEWEQTITPWLRE